MRVQSGMCYWAKFNGTIGIVSEKTAERDFRYYKSMHIQQNQKRTEMFDEEPKIGLDEHQTNDFYFVFFFDTPYTILICFCFHFISFIACAAELGIDKSSSIRTYHIWTPRTPSFYSSISENSPFDVSKFPSGLKLSPEMKSNVAGCGVHGVCGMTTRKSNADMWHINYFISMNLTLINTVMIVNKNLHINCLQYVPRTRR